MKKILIVLLSALFLVACGSNELADFTESFNENAVKNNLPELNQDNFGDIEKEENMSWQLLHDSSRYTVDAKYEDGKNISGYYLVIDKNEPYDEMHGDGYNTGITIIEAIGLDIDQYETEYEIGLTTSHSYTDGDYRISFANPGADGITSVGMIINYDKK